MGTSRTTPRYRGGKACIDGTRIAVVDIVVLDKPWVPARRDAGPLHAPPYARPVHSALAYYYDNRDEIEAYFEESQRAAAELEAERAEVPEPPSGPVVPRRFPLFTDENIDGPIIRGLRQRGWDVQHATSELGEQTKDAPLFRLAASLDRAFVSTDKHMLKLAKSWLEAGRPSGWSGGNRARRSAFTSRWCLTASRNWRHATTSSRIRSPTLKLPK